MLVVHDLEQEKHPIGETYPAGQLRGGGAEEAT